MSHEDQNDEQFTEWARSLPKPCASDPAKRDSLAAALASRRRGPSVQIMALAACWIAIGFFYLNAGIDSGTSSSPATYTRQLPDPDTESFALLAELYPQRSLFQLY